MQKIVKTLAATLVILALVGVIVGYFFLARLPDTISNHLTQAMKVPVSIQDIGAGWNEIRVINLQINNPPQPILSKAFVCKKISVNAPFTHYLHDRIIIDEIVLDGTYLGLEFDSATATKGNWTTIMKNLQDSTDSTPSTRSVLIKRLLIKDLDVDVVYRKSPNDIHHLPRIPQMELTNISSDTGMPMNQLMNSVLGEMLKEVFIKQNLNNMLQDLLRKADPTRGLNPLRGLFKAEIPNMTIESKQTFS